MPISHDYVVSGELDKLKEHLSSNPNNVHETNLVITHTVY